MNIFIACNLSRSYIVAPVEVKTVTYSGSVEGYDYNDARSLCCISFVPEEGTNILSLVEEIRNSCRKRDNLNDLIYVKSEFSKYEKDQRPRIIIRFRNGDKGFADAPSFHFAKSR